VEGPIGSRPSEDDGVPGIAHDDVDADADADADAEKTWGWA
jgi:hypothetical protein